MTFTAWIRPRLRLWAIYNELGYIPWKKTKGKAERKRHGGVYMGTREIIPFMNDDAKRTFSHLLLRPGYMMRDYIQRGQHERYLSPITALLVFFSVFTLLLAIVQPKTDPSPFGNGWVQGVQNDDIDLELSGVGDKGEKLIWSILRTGAQVIVLTHLDQYPEMVDTPWKASLAAVQGDLRSKGIPMFLGNFLLLWIAMSLLLRKRGISVSGAAAASAYVLCQYCIFMFLALLLSFGRSAELGLLLMAVLLFIDYRQWLGIDWRTDLKLTVKTGLLYVLFAVLFFCLLGTGMILYAVKTTA